MISRDSETGRDKWVKHEGFLAQTILYYDTIMVYGSETLSLSLFFSETLFVLSFTICAWPLTLLFMYIIISYKMLIISLEINFIFFRDGVVSKLYSFRKQWKKGDLGT